MIFFGCLIIKKFFFFISLFFLIKCEYEDKCLGCKVSDDNGNQNKCIPDNDDPDKQNLECDDNCRPNLYSGECIYCKYERSNLLKPYKIEGSRCTIVTANNCEKLTYENNQCVENCEGGFELGSYCFKSCENSLPDLEIIPGSNKCKCKYYYNEIDIDGKKYYQCVDNCTYYYNLESHQCLNECENNSRIKGNICKDKCDLPNEFLYKVDEGDNTKYYCVGKCPENKKFYYPNNLPQEENECLPSCNDGDYYSLDNDNNYICKSSCDDNNKMIYIDSSENIYQCTNNVKISGSSLIETYSCPDTFPFQYQNLCLRDCKDTLEVLNIKTYALTLESNDEEDTIPKRFCSENCLEDNDKSFHNENSCLSSCRETSSKFFLGKECKMSCEGFYSYHMEDGECVHLCSEKNYDDKKYYLVNKEKACYEECPKNSEYKYLNFESNECNTCNKPEILGNPQSGEGYIYEDINQNILYCYNNPKIKPVEPSTEPPTYNYYYHKFDNNILITDINSCEELDEYKYHIPGEDYINYICYKSCKDISVNYKYQYGYECYTSEQVIGEYSKHYYIESEIRHYLPVENLKEICINKMYLYRRIIIDNDQDENDVYQYVQKCNEDEYIIPYDNDKINDVENFEFGQCLETCPTEENSEIFYSEEERICRKDCPYKKIFLLSSPEPRPIQNINGIGNCVTKCPSGYVEGDDGNCYDDCQNKYYLTTERKKICVNDCKSIKKFSIGDNKKCFDKCIDDNGQSYYYNDKYECLDSCLSNNETPNKLFSLEKTDEPQPCLQKCPQGYEYYDDNEKICKPNCGENYFLENTESKECIKSCGEGDSYIINGNICSESGQKCTKEQPFYISKISGTKIINKCTTKCELEDPTYKYYMNKTETNDNLQIYQCLPSCDLYFGNECVNECPDGFYNENNICKLKCSDSYKYSKKLHKCVSKCEEENEDYTTLNRECVSKCPLGENFIGIGKQCKNKCDHSSVDEKHFIDTETTDISYKIYKCQSDCSHPYKKVEGREECVSECPYDRPYYNSDDNTCYSLCLNAPSLLFSLKKEEEISGTIKTIFTCIGECPEGKENYQNDKVCINGCVGINNIINMQDKSCVNKCNLNSYFKFLKTEIVESVEGEQTEIKNVLIHVVNIHLLIIYVMTLVQNHITF